MGNSASGKAGFSVVSFKEIKYRNQEYISSEDLEGSLI